MWKRFEGYLIYWKKSFSSLNHNKFSNLDKFKEMNIKVCIIVKKWTIKAKYSPYKQKVGFYLYFLRLYNKLSYYVSVEEMKVKNDLRDMFKKVIIFDAILAVVLISLVQFIFPKYSLVVLGGLVLALINFIINGIITEYMLLNKKSRYVLGNLLGFVVRVVLVCGIAIIIYRRDQINVIAYMLGYSLHFISLTLYGIKINKWREVINWKLLNLYSI